MEREHTRSDRGYAMAALLVAMSVIAIVVSTTLPVFSTMAKRERETELIFRGQQYARAVMLFQRKYANALPPNVDVLLNERFLRKQFKDPITNDDFQFIGPGSPELALAATAAPVQPGTGGAQRGGGPPIVQQQSPIVQQQQQQQQQSGMSARGVQSNPITAGQAPGGILGVVSKSKATSLRVFQNHDKYNEWVFVATQMSVQAGGPTGEQMPGGRGGQPLGAGPGRGEGRGRNGQPDGRGGFGQPFPRGGPGPGPGRNPGGFGGPGTGTQGRPGGGRF
jgi:type II secretory pathway pseudopilin PulG